MTCAAPYMHIIVGPNGAGKSTLHSLSQGALPCSLEFVNADVIAAERWPGDEEAHGYVASLAAANRRSELIGQRKSFVTETVFSHKSKIRLLQEASEAGYVIVMHVVMVSEDLAVERVKSRVMKGGHSVPEDKIRSRHKRSWENVRSAMSIVDAVYFYDNSLACDPLRVIGG